MTVASNDWRREDIEATEQVKESSGSTAIGISY